MEPAGSQLLGVARRRRDLGVRQDRVVAGGTRPAGHRGEALGNRSHRRPRRDWPLRHVEATAAEQRPWPPERKDCRAVVEQQVMRAPAEAGPVRAPGA